MEDLIYRNEKLREENNILKALLENTHTHLAYLDRDFNFVYINEAYASGSGHSKAELVGKNHFAFFPNPENKNFSGNAAILQSRSVFMTSHSSMWTSRKGA
ncbi:MAG: PAS domain S-box protein [Fibrobacter sp.]|jgi:PAS domain S-box-containing protein|nr:PAS domain S-box protein [Fibrobacter sp.]